MLRSDGWMDGWMSVDSVVPGAMRKEGRKRLMMVAVELLLMTAIPLRVAREKVNMILHIAFQFQQFELSFIPFFETVENS